MADWTTEYQQMIDDCEARESRLDEWACRFLDSIKAQIAEGRPLTAKQIEKLDDVWARATARG